MSDLLAQVPVTRLPPDGHYGPAGTEGVRARALEGLAAATLAARKGGTGALIARLAAAGLPLVDGPRALFQEGLTVLGTGPGRWLVFAENTTGPALLARLRALAGDDVALTDQSDANVVFELTGPAVREALAKGVALDLDPRAFAPGDVATTVVSHVGVTLWACEAAREGAPPYRLAVARSFAPALLRWLTPGAAPFGLALSGTSRG